MFDLLIIGGGVAGVSCALVLGSAKNKLFMGEKKIGIIAHQKTSSLQNAVFNNAYGIKPGTLGSLLLTESKENLHHLYPHIIQIEHEKVIEIKGHYNNFEIITNKNIYQAKNILVAIGYSNTFDIKGLMPFVIAHQKAEPQKLRIQLQNLDHLVSPGIYVAGTLAGWRSQLAIAAGSGAAVATDLLTTWNQGNPTQSHDKI